MKRELVIVDGQKYIRSDLQEKENTLNGLERCVIRSYGAGVFVGYVKEKKAELNGVNVTLLKSKRIYYWDGACSLTQLAMEGVKKPENCKITEAIDEQFIADVVEILPLYKNASKNIDEVKVWKS